MSYIRTTPSAAGCRVSQAAATTTQQGIEHYLQRQEAEGGEDGPARTSDLVDEGSEHEKDTEATGDGPDNSPSMEGSGSNRGRAGREEPKGKRQSTVFDFGTRGVTRLGRNPRRRAQSTHDTSEQTRKAEVKRRLEESRKILQAIVEQRLKSQREAQKRRRARRRERRERIASGTSDTTEAHPGTARARTQKRARGGEAERRRWEMGEGSSSGERPPRRAEPAETERKIFRDISHLDERNLDPY